VLCRVSNFHTRNIWPLSPPAERQRPRLLRPQFTITLFPKRAQICTPTWPFGPNVVADQAEPALRRLMYGNTCYERMAEFEEPYLELSPI
jgi:hypothetical protein